MKKNLTSRILAALTGMLVIAGSLCALGETFFRLPLTAALGKLLSTDSPFAVLIVLLLCIALCLLGGSCVLVAFPGRKQHRNGFVMQKGENGTIGVSVKSIEGLVESCIRTHEVIAGAEIAVQEKRDGIIILLDIQEAAGVNIPLAVGALQKQVRQYVSDCTGVEVLEVRVLVENCEADAGHSPYRVEKAAAPAATPVLAVAEETIPMTPAAEEAADDEREVFDAPYEEPMVAVAGMSEEPLTAEEEPEAAPVIPVNVQVAIPEIPELPEEDERPLHQRVFGTEDEPAIVPAPPELMMPVVQAPEELEVYAEDPEPVEAEPAEAAPELAEIMDEDAVAQVAQVVAMDSAAMYDAAGEDGDAADASVEDAAEDPLLEQPEQL